MKWGPMHPKSEPKDHPMTTKADLRAQIHDLLEERDAGHDGSEGA